MIKSFLNCSKFVVVGASKTRTKLGNQVLINYMNQNLDVIPVHPRDKSVEGIFVQQLPDIASSTDDIAKVGISVVTYRYYFYLLIFIVHLKIL